MSQSPADVYRHVCPSCKSMRGEACKVIGYSGQWGAYRRAPHKSRYRRLGVEP